MKNVIITLLKKDVKNNFDDLTDEFMEELVVLSYNSDVDLGEKIYGEMQSKLDDEDLVDELMSCLDKIKDLTPFKEYLKSHVDYLNDEAETLLWLFSERGNEDEALFWLNQIKEEETFNEAKQYFETFFSLEELCEKIINETEKLNYKYSYTIIDKVIKQDNQVIITILRQL